MGQYILAHDLGTSGNKATLYRSDGTLAASVVVSYETSYPHPGWVEQNPEDWWHAVCTSTRKLLEKSQVRPKEVACVSFSAQMMGCLLVDKEGTPLRPMITWADIRAAKQEKEIIEALGMERVYRITGHRASASYSAAKLLWIRENEPQVYQRAYKMLHAKDFIIHRLTGRFVTDYSDASGTNLFDIQRKEWSREICQALNLPPGLLPEPHASAEIAGGITSAAAKLCGLVAGTPVVIGGGDGSCACVGAGVVSEGSAYCVLGSSAWISTASKEPVFDKDMRTFNWVHLDPRLYTPCGTMQAAGVSYSWYRDTLCEEEKRAAKETGESAYERMNAVAALTQAGAGGVLFLPYLLGERSPRWNHEARGAFVGMDVTTTKADLTRAVMEGVGYNLKVILDILEEWQPVEKLTLIGGGAKGRLWLQILSDIWQKPLEVPLYLEEATSLGAAVCGGVGIGLFSNYAVAQTFNRTTDLIEPNRGNKECYGILYEAFNRAYQALAPVYENLADFKGKSG